MASRHPQQARTDELEPPKDTAGVDSYVASNTRPMFLGKPNYMLDHSTRMLPLGV